MTIPAVRDASAANALQVADGEIGDVQVEQRARGGSEQLIEHFECDHGGRVVVDVFSPLDRHGESRKAELARAQDGPHRARVQDAAPNVRPSVDARDDNVGLEVKAAERAQNRAQGGWGLETEGRNRLRSGDAMASIGDRRAFEDVTHG